MGKRQFTVKSTADYVQINYIAGAEALYWDQLEWVEDPALVGQIAEAIRQAYEEPERLIDFLKAKEKRSQNQPMYPKELVRVWADRGFRVEIYDLNERGVIGSEMDKNLVEFFVYDETHSHTTPLIHDDRYPVPMDCTVDDNDLVRAAVAYYEGSLGSPPDTSWASRHDRVDELIQLADDMLHDEYWQQYNPQVMAVFEMDKPRSEGGEANGTVHWFCNKVCMETSMNDLNFITALKLPEYETGPNDSPRDGSVCECCGKELPS